MGMLGDLSPQGSIAIGVLVGLVSTSLQAIGLTLQRKSHILEDEKYPYDIRRPPYKRTRWQTDKLGMFMFVLSNIVGSTIQITTLPLPVLSTLQALIRWDAYTEQSGLVFNTIFATLILGEPFTRYSFGGTILVCTGAILIAIFGAIGEPAHTLDQLLELLGRPAFLRWMAGTAVIVVITLLGARILKGFPTSGRTSGWSFIKHVHTSHHHHSPRLKMLRGLLYSAVSGILSAHSLLVAKAAVELLVRTILDGVNQFNRWQSWIILLGLIVLALTQLYYMHRGLKLCSTSILYPFVFCIYNIIAILDGLIYFRQVSRLSGLHAGLIALGTVILLSGVLCLSWRLDELSSQPETVPAPGALTPGLGLLDEQVTTPTYTDFIYPPDEESYPAERQPLLLDTHSQQRTPSRRYTSSTSRRHRHSINITNEAAQIWADLYDENNPRQEPSRPPTSPASLHRAAHHKRQRSKSGTTLSSPSNTPQHLPSSPSPQPRRHKSTRLKGLFKKTPSNPHPHRNGNNNSNNKIWRRASTPVVLEESPEEQTTIVHRDVSATAHMRNARAALSESPTNLESPQPVERQDDNGTDDDEQGSVRGNWFSRRLFRRR
ncbi:hypothetical protein PRK78_002210 [Emydomyces testavorans]|uniref:DUF803 domain-containing protein n=1 Tax=Emydomyces testavorans TaxID=2070801 RepID=A0AAF0IJF4_9EURO|nr:hypothetical protein PRK78_002210 [Emydomyces testavorans]